MRRAGLIAIVTLALASGACAGPDDADGTIVVYVPEAGGVPARMERMDVADESWRRPAATPAIQPGTRDAGSLHLRPVVGDAGAVFDSLIEALASNARTFDEIVPRLGPSPVVDSETPRVEVSVETRPCSAAGGATRLPEVRARTCPADGGDYTAVGLVTVTAYRDFADVRRTFASVGYRALAAGAADETLHLPRPDTDSVFVGREGDPVIVVNHLREGPPRPATVNRVTLVWPGRR